ncbi:MULTISPECIES: hypothetical protein [Sphingomonas]|jgi:hypothetical protein|uniref:Uncharacterized protein n=1 Tax=Sphingomonas zeae TaxID=1646122 RepID=A0A7Y6B5L6_9SPHN|nr:MULTISPECIES: hypothetical protein [Sphingomonas]MBB4049746.1 hypothetical protein [Sphingomonas zeae]MDK8185786.1 hypothetical protein [Sphingomonas zeae]MDK8215075.1 hypothetical protein [Sphingomonas sp. UMB7805-LC452B]NUU47814.1 hypothetical protein [Sphingomonas zeae]
MRLGARAWTALAVPPVTWFVFEQGLSAVLHSDCGRSGLGVAWGAASLAVCLGALWFGWPYRTRRSSLSNVWLARSAMLVAGFFALAIGFQTLAVLWVPPCVA